MMTQRWLTSSQAAQLLGVNPKTLARHAKDGKIPHSKTTGGHCRFDAQVIQALVEQLSEPATVHIAGRASGAQPSPTHSQPGPSQPARGRGLKRE